MTQAIFIIGPGGLFWNEAHGWVPLEVATEYPPDAMSILTPPEGGRWWGTWV